MALQEWVPRDGRQYALSVVWKFIKGWDWKVEILQASLAFVEMAVRLILKLVAMTFNVGLFLAVCAGAFLRFSSPGVLSFMKHGYHSRLPSPSVTPKGRL